MLKTKFHSIIVKLCFEDMISLYYSLSHVLKIQFHCIIIKLCIQDMNLVHFFSNLFPLAMRL